MFRLTRLLSALHAAERPLPPERPVAALAPVVIWNLIRRCNLTCRHCYSTSADKDFAGELSHAEACAVMDDLHRYGVRTLILSGGEPLMRPDIFELSRRAKAMGFYVGLSSNGTLIDEANAAAIAETGYDYVGVSIDGMGATHDQFRRRPGAFQQALRGIRLCRDAGLKVGLRFTLTRDNAEDLPDLLRLMERERIEKFYLSHLNYAGRGHRNRRRDTHHQMTRQAMDLLFATCWAQIQAGQPREYVTGNNDADGVYLLHWLQAQNPQKLPRLQALLRHWGGNASGERIANIDNLGGVHPDTMWWDYTIGNVRERPFSAIWSEPGDPLMRGLRQRPRPLQGRCAACAHLALCNGNSRTRAWRTTGNPWAEDPGCYLSDAEVAITGADPGRATAPLGA